MLHAVTARVPVLTSSTWLDGPVTRLRATSGLSSAAPLVCPAASAASAARMIVRMALLLPRDRQPVDDLLHARDFLGLLDRARFRRGARNRPAQRDHLAVRVDVDVA